jgi:hypothetical protein
MNTGTSKKQMTTNFGSLHQPASNITTRKRNHSFTPLADITQTILNQITTNQCNNVVTPDSAMPSTSHNTINTSVNVLPTFQRPMKNVRGTNLIDRFSATIPENAATSVIPPRGKKKEINHYFNSNKIHRPQHQTTNQQFDSSSSSDSDSDDDFNQCATSDSDTELCEDMPEEVDAFLQGKYYD